MHWNLQTYIVLAIAASLVVMLPFVLRSFARNACPRCYYPLHRCECKPACDHAEQFPAIWSQDGWIAKCKTCGDIVYLGDD